MCKGRDSRDDKKRKDMMRWGRKKDDERTRGGVRGQERGIITKGEIEIDSSTTRENQQRNKKGEKERRGRFRRSDIINYYSIILC
jgi:hypothetical protein